MAHYTANIEVTRTWTEQEAPEPTYGSRTPVPEKVRKTESFRVTVRADSLEKLKAKVIAHVQLVDTDDVRGGN